MDYTEEELTQAYRDMAETHEGKMILDDLNESFYNIHACNPGQVDANRAMFVEGCRWVVGYIRDQVNQKDPVPKSQDNPNRSTYL